MLIGLVIFLPDENYSGETLSGWIYEISNEISAI